MEAKSFYQELMDKGYSRRDFLKFCGMMGAMLGLQSSGVAQVVDALQANRENPFCGITSKNVPVVANHSCVHPILW